MIDSELVIIDEPTSSFIQGKGIRQLRLVEVSYPDETKNKELAYYVSNYTYDREYPFLSEHPYTDRTFAFETMRRDIERKRDGLNKILEAFDKLNIEMAEDFPEMADVYK